MTIQSEDIKLLKSERLTDNEDGGGRITGNEVSDGESNNLFPDISDLDRTYGRVSLRKAYAAVQTDDTDMYFGGHIIVDEIPEDPNVGISLFTTRDWNDLRKDARNRIEAYVVGGAVSSLKLMNDQLPGQRQISCYQPVDRDVPEIGDVLLLSTESQPNDVDESVVGQQQYVRVTDKQVDIRTFEDRDGEYERMVVVLEISDTLKHRFYGEVVSRFTNTMPDTRLRDTTVADASRYYTTTKLRDSAGLGDGTVRVNDVFTPVVPASRSEIPFLDQAAAANITQTIPVGATVDQSVNMSPGVRRYTTIRPIVPGTLKFLSGTENGDGILRSSTGNQIATVNYDQGVIVITDTSTRGGNFTCTYKPGVVVSSATFTQEAAITLATRRFNFTFNLSPLPYQRTVNVDYRSQGQWYRLTDNLAGELVGNQDGLGSGTVDRSTGTVLATLGALPDVGSSVIVQWSTENQYEKLEPGNLEVDEFRFDYDGVYSNEQGSISWKLGNTTKTATITYGVISGDGTGQSSGRSAKFRPDAYPAPGTTYTFDIKENNYHKTIGGPVETDGNEVVGKTAEGDIDPGSFRWTHTGKGVEQPTDRHVRNTYYPATIEKLLEVRDNGNGELVGNVDYSKNNGIDYETGEYRFTPLIYFRTHVRAEDRRGRRTFSYDRAECYIRAAEGEEYQARYQVVGSTGDEVTKTYAPTSIEVPVFSRGRPPIANSLIFRFNGRVYYDHNGSLYTDYNAQTGQGREAGSINYDRGVAQLTDWAVGSGTPYMIGGVTRLARPLQRQMVFRTPGSPLAPASTNVRATNNNGEPYNVTCNQDGEFGRGLPSTGLDGPGGTGEPTDDETNETDNSQDYEGINGVVDQEMGIVRIKFGQPVFPDSVLYNTVSFKYLPLDPTILGLDPVRLPQDGKVIAFKPADVVVIHHTASKTYQSLSSGQTLDAGRVRLASVALVDSEGEELPPTYYTTDLDAGTLTLTSQPPSAAFTAPFTFKHRVEDMQIASDVQINGYIDFVGQLSHDYPEGETLVSSAMVTGDLQARYTNLFEQETWGGVYRDQLTGNATTAQYNDTTYPLLITNRGATTERWALVFTSNTNFRVVGENVGQIAVGSIDETCAPNNPNTNVPYFQINPLGWGSGWSAGNVVRFNTIGASYPAWISRTILQGAASGDQDDFRLQIRGNANRDV